MKDDTQNAVEKAKQNSKEIGSDILQSTTGIGGLVFKFLRFFSDAIKNMNCIANGDADCDYIKPVVLIAIILFSLYVFVQYKTYQPYPMMQMPAPYPIR